MTKLMRVDIDGTVTDVDNTYQGIRDGVGGTITFVRVDARLGVYVDDNGLINGLALNPAASMIAGQALYGPAVLCAGDPDSEGDSVPLAARDRKGMAGVAERWSLVVRTAREFMGQEVTVYADPDTVPPPRIVPLPDDWMPGDPIPGAP